MPRAAPHTPEEAYDQWLVVRAQGGDEAALRELVARWSAPLRRHAVRLTRDPDGAADATQDAWIAIVRGLGRLEDPACFRRWAYRIVGNKCADWVRRQQRRRATTTPLTDEPPASTPEPQDAADPTHDLRATLRRLPDKDRTLLALHYVDGMAVAEIAEAMAVPVGTVKSRLFHARRRLKEALRRDAVLEPPDP